MERGGKANDRPVVGCLSRAFSLFSSGHVTLPACPDQVLHNPFVPRPLECIPEALRTQRDGKPIYCH